jgi:hypothetical protein
MVPFSQTWNQLHRYVFSAICRTKIDVPEEMFTSFTGNSTKQFQN